ncbi:MAG: hypothetical protein MUE49_00940 [Rhodospirillales bacterium]|jgi:hypothetical protein|nr:hypothetical protein [Rhodospirillales bacterium]
MISKVDFRDFFEINSRLYGDNSSQSASITFLMQLLDSLEARRAEGGLPTTDPRHR